MFLRKLQWMSLMALVLVALVACGGGGDETAAPLTDSQQSQPQLVSVGDAVRGKQQYDMVCIACHGPDGSGVEGLGKPFTTSDFTASLSDEELLAFIKIGRPMSDPLNTTGVDMPPKGGNPALTDEQILDIIAYIRSLHE
ncbi:MAG: cytochrome c [Chloroflexota bacterium]|jgi:mono/diheme cytochrome c family protein